MTRSALSPEELDLIRGVLARYPWVTVAVLFGSRAKGTATATSDVDIALEGELEPLRVQAIATELDELPLPYRFDVVALATLRSGELREHIERVGVMIYERTPELDTTEATSGKHH